MCMVLSKNRSIFLTKFLLNLYCFYSIFFWGGAYDAMPKSRNKNTKCIRLGIQSTFFLKEFEMLFYQMTLQLKKTKQKYSRI